MELVKTEFKQREVGLIPVDWEVKELNRLTNITRLAGYEYSTYWEETLNGEIIALRGFNIGKNKIIEREFVRISNVLSMRLIRSRLFKGDIIYPCVGTIGNATVINEDNKYHIQQNIAKITPLKDIIDSNYLAYYLMSDFGLTEIKKFNGTSSQPNILVGSLRQYSIILPPTLKEQKAIATALSDVDALIHSLEALIAKKKAIKQGAMQELLTGKTRLAGFENDKGYQETEVGLIPVDWVSCEFQDVLTGFSSGMTPYRGTPEFYRGDIPWVTSGELNYNIIYDTIEKVTEDAVIKTNLKLLPVGTFLMAITGLEAKGTRGSCAITGVRATTNQSCMALYPKDNKIVTEYLYHFYINYGDELAFKFCQGTKQQSYTGKIVKILPINLPSSIKEQKAIAETLSNMDKEIQALQTKKEKYQGIKQGMMQELLTGKTRLI